MQQGHESVYKTERKLDSFAPYYDVLLLTTAYPALICSAFLSESVS